MRKEMSGGTEVRVNNNRIFRYVVMIAVLIIGMSVWWNISLSQASVSDEWILESADGNSFAAEDSVITQIGICNDNAASVSETESTPEAFSIEIKDASGNTIWSRNVTDATIPVRKLEPLPGLVTKPISLQKGKTYQIVCTGDRLQQESLSFSFYGARKSLISMYLSICALIILICSTGYFYATAAVRRHGMGVFAIVMILLTIAGSIAMVPLCVPDEEIHFSNAYAISNQIMQVFYLQDSQAALSGITRTVAFGDAQYSWNFWNNHQYGNTLLADGGSQYTLIGMMPHYSYVISAIALTLTRILHAPYQVVLMSGRFANLLFYVLIVLIAAKINPGMKWVLAAISFLPSTLWIVNSYSYDGWNLALCILLFCYCAHCRDCERVSWKHFITVFAITVLMVPVKFIYFVMVFSVLLIPKEKISLKHKKAALLIGAVAIGAVAVLLFATRGDEVIAFLGNHVDNRSDALTTGTSYSLPWVIRHPGEVFLVFGNTLITYLPKYIGKCFVGDNFDSYVPSFYDAIIIILFIIIICGSTARGYLTKRDKAVSAGVFILGSLAVLGSFLFLYSVPGTDRIGLIEGVQGRYFLPYLICLPYVFGGKIRISDQNKTFVVAGMVLCTAMTILCRFAGIILS
jgi:uncharacterized membrane protein